MSDLNRTIDKGNQYTATSMVDALQTQIHARQSSALPGIEQMPLTFEQWIRPPRHDRRFGCDEREQRIITAIAASPAGGQQARNQTKGQCGP